MCGITGLIDFSRKTAIHEQLLSEMASPLKFRGPDQKGTCIIQDEQYSLGFGHRRLSIIDLSEQGKQPMADEDDTYVIVFNGEIYNYTEIKKQLKRKHFRSNSDTEIILYAIKEWGLESTLERMQGMFALAVFDRLQKTLFLARDRFGEKPLYYSIQGQLLAFSSDIRSFKALPIPLSIDGYALEYFFSELSTPIDRSIYKEVQKLKPSCYISFKEGEVKITSYATLNYSDKIVLTENQILEQTAYLIENAVIKTLVSDVPVGCFLSGGIDSSLVALFAAKNYGKRIDTFSIGFDYEPFNELPYARTVAEQIDSNHHEIVLNPKDLSIVDELLKEYGEPFADSSAIPTYYVSKFASGHVKVALGGDGGDELFGGYRTYNQGLRMQKWHDQGYLKLPLQLLSRLSNHSKIHYLSGVLGKDGSTLASALYRNMGFSSSELIELLPESWPPVAPDLEHVAAIEEALNASDTIFDALLHASIRTRLVNDYLVKTDRASMFNSLELRTPFLDKELAAFTRTIPHGMLMKNGMNKYLTKKIAEKYFSKEFIYREKQGFGIPIGLWMKNEWKKQFEEVVFAKQTLVSLNYTFIEELFKKHVSGGADYTHRLWAIYVFHKWANQ